MRDGADELGSGLSGSYQSHSTRTGVVARAREPEPLGLEVAHALALGRRGHADVVELHGGALLPAARRLGRGLLLRQGRLELDLEALDARPVDLDDPEEQAVGLDLVARLRGPAEHPEDEPGERVVLLRQIGAEAFVEVVDRERAVDADAVVRDLLDRLVGQVVLVLDLADDLLEQVLSVTIPCTEPYSSTTGQCWFRRRNSAEERGQVLVSGTTYAGRTMCSMTTFSIPRSYSAWKRSRTCRTPASSRESR